MARVVVQPYLIPRIQRWLELCRGSGIFITITSSYRSPALQRKLYAAYLARGRRGLPAARPGHSLHETGEAIDFSARWNPSYGRRGIRATPAGAYTAAGILGEEAGLRWGGRFSQSDPVHLDAGLPWWSGG